MSEPPVDAGLDSEADLCIFTRVLLFGVVAIVIVAGIVFLVTGDLAVVGVLAVAYGVIAVSQWYAAYRRARVRDDHGV